MIPKHSRSLLYSQFMPKISSCVLCQISDRITWVKFLRLSMQFILVTSSITASPLVPLVYHPKRILCSRRRSNSAKQVSIHVYLTCTDPIHLVYTHQCQLMLCKNLHPRRLAFERCTERVITSLHKTERHS